MNLDDFTEWLLEQRPDESIGDKDGWAYRYNIGDLMVVVELPPGVNDYMISFHQEDGSVFWEEMKSKYEAAPAPSPDDYVIETQVGIHQRFHVVPIRQDFYKWKDALYAIAAHQKFSNSEKPVWLHEGGGNFQLLDLQEELSKIEGV